MRAGETAATGTSGQSFVKATFEALGWAVVPNPEHDLGTDLWLSPRDPRRFDLGLMLGAQVKNGQSWFDEEGEKGTERGWWHRNDRQHFDYWLRHAVPHILVLRHPGTGLAYWVHISDDAVEWTGTNGKVFVPEGQLLSADALDALIDIAAAAKPAPRWAGSAWTGAANLSQNDALRFAMLAPRLVAPHPNAGIRDLAAHEALALLTAGRFGELHRYGLLQPAKERSGWTWDFFSALYELLTAGTLDGLRSCVVSAREPHERAASAVALSAALVEEGSCDEALAVVQAPLDADVCQPIDHGWLQVHRGRCLVELGSPAEAIQLAVSVQGLPALFPDDVTAAAIAGSGAALLFRASGIMEGDVAHLITSSDTETAWWRAQALSWGLGSMFDESFRRWTRNDNAVRFGASDPAHRLRGVSLVDGFTASHDAWCHSLGSLAKWYLMRGGLSSQDAAGCITDLRRVGDKSGVAAAVAHLLEAGPALAVRDAAGLVDLHRVTHTEASASVELLVRGADVLGEETADAAARWALSGADELLAWDQRVQPGFLVETRRAELLRALLPVVSPGVRDQVLNHIVSLPPIPDQGDAHAWAGLVGAVPVGEWTTEQVASLLARAEDNWELEHAIRRVGIQVDPVMRRANDDLLRSGAADALEWVGRITSVPEDAVGPLVATLSRELRRRITEARQGMHAAYAGVDPGRALVLLNVHFPDSANWAPVVELILEPLASPRLVEETLQTIGAFADEVRAEAPAGLVDALEAVAVRVPIPLPLLGHDLRPAAIRALDALSHEDEASTRWLAVRDPRGRAEFIRGIAKRGNSEDAGVLVALAADPDPRIRATAAQALSYWITNGVSPAASTRVLEHLLTDQGTLLARRVVGEWSEVPDDRVNTLAAMLTGHPSAYVRSAAQAALANGGGEAPSPG